MDQLASPFKLYLLGAPRLEYNGTPVVIDRRKAVALLAYLALTRQTHLRDAIACLLWPDSGQRSARANLRHTLFVLKQALGDDLLTMSRESVALQAKATLWVDVLHFQTLLTACRSHGHPPDASCPDCLPLLTKAVALPVEQFMAGFSLTDCPAFDDWQRTQRQQLLQTLSDALDRLIGHFSQKGEYKAAIEHAQQRLALDTFDEASHRQLMQLYGWSGQQGLALRQFEQCTAILTEELDIPPSAETVNLLREIQSAQAATRKEALGVVDAHLQQATVAEIPPPAEIPRHNLPVRLPTLIGRDHDLRALQKLVQRKEVNLVTLIGPGGVGKTQLSFCLASTLLDHFPDGVFIISLAMLREPEQMVFTLAQTWNLQYQNHQPLLEIVQGHLRDKQMLLVLDSFDHLMASAPLLSELLANCKHLCMVVTSRELLNIRVEHVYTVSPLSLPKLRQSPSIDEIASSAAVQLFVQRAQAITSKFALDDTNATAIAAICIHLDGLPLAIELVVAWIRLLSPQTLRQRLLGPDATPFKLLRGGARDAPLRHHALKDTIGWSYELLPRTEQQLFCLLGVFVGGCTLEAVEYAVERLGVTTFDSVLDGLASLENKSLIQQTVQANGESRFSMLEMIREFALDQFQANDAFDLTMCAYADTYAAFAEIAIPALAGPDHRTWIQRLNADHNNCQAALDWAISHQHTELATRLAGALWGYWLERGYYREGRRFLEMVLHLTGSSKRTAGRATLLMGFGALCRTQGDMDAARSALEEAVSICRELNDELMLATAVERLVVGCTLDFNLSQIDQLCTEAFDLYKKANNQLGAIRISQQFGMQNYYNGDYAAAKAIFEEALTIYRSQQHEAETGQTLCNLGRVLFQQQKFPEAKQCFTQALAKAQERGDQRLSGQTLYFLGRLAYYHTDYQKAKSLLEESLRINRTIGTRAAEIAFTLVYLGAIARDNGDMQTAKEMSNDALMLTYQEPHIYAISLILPFHASLALIQGEHSRAVQLIAAGQSLYRNLGIYLPPNDQLTFVQPLATARQRLPSNQFTEAWANGELMTVDEAVSLALGPLFI